MKPHTRERMQTYLDDYAVVALDESQEEMAIDAHVSAVIYFLCPEDFDYLWEYYQNKKKGDDYERPQSHT